MSRIILSVRFQSEQRFATFFKEPFQTDDINNV